MSRAPQGLCEGGVNPPSGKPLEGFALGEPPKVRPVRVESFGFSLYKVERRAERCFARLLDVMCVTVTGTPPLTWANTHPGGL